MIGAIICCGSRLAARLGGALQVRGVITSSVLCGDVLGASAGSAATQTDRLYG